MACRTSPPVGRKPAPRAAGFTLIELLVVIAIIALLVAILVPSVMRATALARRAACQGGLKAIGAAAGMYQSAHGEHIPICWANMAPSVARPFKSWRTTLLPYTSGYQVFNCPAARNFGVNRQLFSSVDELISDSPDVLGTATWGTYGVIHQSSLPGYTTASAYGTEIVGNPTWSQAFSTVPGRAWADPANSIYVADCTSAVGPVSYPTQCNKGYGASVIFKPGTAEYAKSPAARFSDRHIGTNCLFLDGRVVSYQTKDLDAMVEGDANCVWDVN